MHLCFGTVGSVAVRTSDLLKLAPGIPVGVVGRLYEDRLVTTENWPFK